MFFLLFLFFLVFLFFFVLILFLFLVFPLILFLFYLFLLIFLLPILNLYWLLALISIFAFLFILLGLSSIYLIFDNTFVTNFEQLIKLITFTFHYNLALAFVIAPIILTSSFASLFIFKFIGEFWVEGMLNFMGRLLFLDCMRICEFVIHNSLLLL